MSGVTVLNFDSFKDACELFLNDKEDVKAKFKINGKEVTYKVSKKVIGPCIFEFILKHFNFGDVGSFQKCLTEQLPRGSQLNMRVTPKYENFEQAFSQMPEDKKMSLFKFTIENKKGTFGRSVVQGAFNSLIVTIYSRSEGDFEAIKKNIEEVYKNAPEKRLVFIPKERIHPMVYPNFKEACSHLEGLEEMTFKIEGWSDFFTIALRCGPFGYSIYTLSVPTESDYKDLRKCLEERYGEKQKMAFIPRYMGILSNHNSPQKISSQVSLGTFDAIEGSNAQGLRIEVKTQTPKNSSVPGSVIERLSNVSAATPVPFQ